MLIVDLLLQLQERQYQKNEALVLKFLFLFQYLFNLAEVLFGVLLFQCID